VNRPSPNQRLDRLCRQNISNVFKLCLVPCCVCGESKVEHSVFGCFIDILKCVAALFFKLKNFCNDTLKISIRYNFWNTKVSRLYPNWQTLWLKDDGAVYQLPLNSADRMTTGRAAVSRKSRTCHGRCCSLLYRQIPCHRLTKPCRHPYASQSSQTDKK